MDKSQVLSFIDAEIERLQQARQLLGEVEGQRFGASTRRGAWHMSAEARARISAAQKARWAKQKSGQSGSPAPGRKRRQMSAEGRARIAAAQKARWAKVKAQKKK